VALRGFPPRSWSGGARWSYDTTLVVGRATAVSTR